MNKSRYIIFTDLDGTLLDSKDYSAKAAKEALEYIKDNYIPLIFVSSKTAPEMIRFRKLLGVEHPFICENGGGIFIPKGYFEGAPDQSNFDIISLGENYNFLVGILKEAKSKFNLNLKALSEMTDEEIIRITNIGKEEVPLARQRNFDEPFVINSENIKDDIIKLKEHFQKLGLNIIRGNRFYHLTGNSNKGKAIKKLLSEYEKNYDSGWISLGFGDSPNDIPMFEVVDIPIAVKKPPEPGHYDFKADEFPNLHFADGIGPIGWNKASLKILKESKSK